MLAGCATQIEPVVLPPIDPAPPPPPPAEAMQHAPERSELPEDFHMMDVEDALEILLRAHMQDMDTLRRIEAKHKALIEYIESVK